MFDADTPLRRIADGVVDHLSVMRVAYEVAKKSPSARPYIGLLALRAISVGTLNTMHLAMTGEVTKGNTKQRAVNIASAAFALAATTENRMATHITGGIAAGLAVATASAHFKDLGKKHASGMREL